MRWTWVLLVLAAASGDLFVQWGSQASSGMGSDDTPTFYAARLSASGKLDAPSKGTQSGFQAEAWAAANDGLYIINSGTMQRWTCK